MWGKLQIKYTGLHLKVTLPFESGTSIQGDLHTISCQGFVLKVLQNRRHFWVGTISTNIQPSWSKGVIESL